MRKLLPSILFFKTLILLFSLCYTQNSSAQKADDLIGVWLTTDGKSKVEITKNKETRIFKGTVIWLKNPTDKEGTPRKDPEGNEVLGMDILQNFTFNGDEWADGEIYDPENGDDYYCTITMVNPDKIKVRGSIDPMGWAGRTVYWKRVTKE